MREDENGGEAKLSLKSAFAWLAFIIIMLSAFPFIRAWDAIGRGWKKFRKK